MWIADNWKDYQVIDCCKRRKAGTMGRLYPRPSRPAGDLGYPENRQGMEIPQRTLSS